MARLGAVRLGKGVRLSVSSRGLRAHVGPRAARIHLGGGRTGLSTGAGPFTYYTSGSSSHRSGYSGGPTKAEIARAEKIEEGARLRDEILRIIDIHRVSFPPIEKPSVPAAEQPTLAPYLKRRKQQTLRGLSILKRKERKLAIERATELAEQDLKSEKERLATIHAESTEKVEEDWNRLLENDPETVIATVDAAFEDNEAPAAPVNVEGSTLSLAVLVPGVDAVPERKPAVTPSGNPTVKKMTKAERSDLYGTLICGLVLATIKEALAVAPSITAVEAVVVRRSKDDIYGQRRMEALLAGRYERSDLNRVRWEDVLPIDVVEEAATDLLWNVRGRPPQLQPLDLDEEPELKEFLRVLDQVEEN